jgi:single-strand DNA-binding protein
MNRWIGTGRLTKEPYVSQGQTMVAKFTLAVDGFKKDDTDFIRVVAFGKTAELCQAYLGKGSKVLVEGHIKTGSYEKNGQKVYTTDVIADRVEFLEKMQKQEQSNDSFDDFQEVNDDVFGDSIPF